MPSFATPKSKSQAHRPFAVRAAPHDLSSAVLRAKSRFERLHQREAVVRAGNSNVLPGTVVPRYARTWRVNARWRIGTWNSAVVAREARVGGAIDQVRDVPRDRILDHVRPLPRPQMQLLSVLVLHNWRVCWDRRDVPVGAICSKRGASCLNFAYVCPEPVLAKSHVFILK
jgi:hypothetical protein